ncbi:MAG: hypothetical protein JWN51_1854 [Phycisphaerales bacterium]|nr:hypothetical protein [Phycisphaerales bacterium]
MPKGGRALRSHWGNTWWGGLLALMVTLPILLVVTPPFAILVVRDEYRLRRAYRRGGRLLDWDEARDRLSSGRGTLIIEVLAGGGTGHVWWVEADLLAEGCPLAPAKVLRRTFDVKERSNLLHSESARKWSEMHLPGLIGGVHLVRVPYKVWRRWDEVLTGDRAVAADSHDTFCFQIHRR